MNSSVQTDKISLPNTFIYLIGHPGTGKYTVAKEIAARAEFRIIDNHLINNPVFTVARVDGKTRFPQGVWDNTRKIRDIVLDSIITLAPPHFSFVFTNALSDDPTDQELYQEVLDTATARAACFVPVRLIISDVEEHARRISSPERDLRMKETNPASPAKYAKEPLLPIDHPHLLDLDIARLSVRESTEEILAHAEKIHAARAAKP